MEYHRRLPLYNYQIRSTLSVKKKNSKAFIKLFPGHHIFVTMKEDSSSPPIHYHNEYDKAEKTLKKKNETDGVFFAVNELNEKLDKGRHRTKKMVIRCRAVFMDDDNPRDAPRDDFPLSPSVTVNSSPGKYHYYWLTTTDDKEAWDLVQRALMVRYKGDKQAKDLTRYLRLPGYYHNKRDPFMVTYDGGGYIHTWDKILEAFPPLEADEIEDTKGNVASIADEAQTDDEIDKIIESAGPGLHGAINKRLLGDKRDGVPKMRAIKMVRMMGQMVPDDQRDERWENRFSFDELERSWIGAEDTVIDVPEISHDDTIKGEMPWPPGLFGDLAQSAYNMARFQYREVAIISAVGLVAGICGRKFNAEGAGLNIYATLIMDTGMGKDSINQFITTALMTANDVGTGSSFIGPVRFTGPRAVFNSLESARSQVCVFTEAGLLLNSKSGDGDGLKRVLLGLYTKSGKNSFSGTEMYSETEKGVKSMRAPALSIINESTPEMLLSVFKKGDGLRSGDIPRQLIYRIVGEKPDANRKAHTYAVNEDCLEKIKHLISKCSGVQAVEDPAAWDLEADRTVDTNMIETERYYVKMQNENRNSNTTKYSMATRAYYKAVRLAAIASAFNHFDLSIHEEEWLWAKEMISFEMDGLSHFFKGGGMSDPIADIVTRYAIPVISRILNDQLSIRNGMSRKEHKSGKFKLYEFTQSLKNTQEVIELADTAGYNLKSGQQKLIDYMISNDMLFRVKSARATVYQVTDTFLASCET